MQSPSPELISPHHFYISGEVVVHPTAAIAPGVLLQADPGCRLTVEAGVCIGQAVVLHACQGWLTIGAGTTLGSGVLIIGQGQIGENACIGAFTTILNSSVAADQILPPRSLIGEIGRQVEPSPAAPPTAASQPSPDSTPDPWDAEPAAPPSVPNFKAGFVSGFSAPGRSTPVNGSNGSANGSANGSQPSIQPPNHPDLGQNLGNAPADSLTSAPKPPTQVYGQAYVERIMIAMFPHRRSIEQLGALQSNPTSSDAPPNPPP